jgi:phosphatidylglycerophosphate synthase
MTRIPIILIYSRLFIGFTILFLSLNTPKYDKTCIIILFTIGLLTDVFDGIIARRLNVATPALRRLDSSIDVVFFLCVALATYIQCSSFFKLNAFRIALILAFEGATYLICFLKFRKEIATHSIGAKIWTLFLFATLIEIILKCDSKTLFLICFWLGLITRLEIMAIVLTLKKWTNDVPTLFHAFKIRYKQMGENHYKISKY